MKHFLFLLLGTFIFLGSQTLSAQEFGLASYYADQFHGRKTAYGKVYDKNKLTCAHKRHPLGTRLRVTRLDNKKTVVVTVIDKGPYIAGKIIDLSRAAAVRLDLIDVGVAEVKVEVIGKIDMDKEDAKVANTTTSDKATPKAYEDISPVQQKGASTTPSSNTKSNTQKTNTTVAKRQDTAQDPGKSGNTSATIKRFTEKNTSPTRIEQAPSSPDRASLVGKDYTKFGLYKIQLMKPEIKGYGVQVTALTNYENVLQSVADYQAKGFKNVYINVEPGIGGPVYKIILGMYDNEASAKRYKDDLRRKYRVNGFVVSLIDN